MENLIAWAKEGAKFGDYISFDAQAIRAAAMREVKEIINSALGAGSFWRGTSRKAEYSDVKNGIAIISKNHVSGQLEAGMSVCNSPAYIVAAGYKYGYTVTGDVAGEGSDGETLLVNVKVTSKLMTRAQALASDSARKEKFREMASELGSKVGLTFDQINRAYHA